MDSRFRGNDEWKLELEGELAVLAGRHVDAPNQIALGGGIDDADDVVSSWHDDASRGRISADVLAVDEDPAPWQAADVEGRRRVDDPDLGFLCCRLALARLTLAEAGGDLSPLPGRVVEPAVDDDRLVDRQCPDSRARLCRQRVSDQQREGNEAQECRCPDAWVAVQERDLLA